MEIDFETGTYKKQEYKSIEVLDSDLNLFLDSCTKFSNKILAEYPDATFTITTNIEGNIELEAEYFIEGIATETDIKNVIKEKRDMLRRSESSVQLVRELTQLSATYANISEEMIDIESALKCLKPSSSAYKVLIDKLNTYPSRQRDISYMLDYKERILDSNRQIDEEISELEDLLQKLTKV